MPHPYPQGIAEKWIRTHGRRYVQGKEMVLAITASSTGMVVGSIGAVLNFTFKNAELGYWIGEEYWNRGYATEAARELVRFVFDTLPVHKIYAHCFAGNPASARVLENIGMVKEGVLKEHYFHWGEYKDLLVYGMRAHA
jgi:RimJ/RimL family protein N-acetyltransferase